MTNCTGKECILSPRDSISNSTGGRTEDEILSNRSVFADADDVYQQFRPRATPPLLDDRNANGSNWTYTNRVRRRTSQSYFRDQVLRRPIILSPTTSSIDLRTKRVLVVDMITEVLGIVNADHMVGNMDLLCEDSKYKSRKNQSDQ